MSSMRESVAGLAESILGQLKALVESSGTVHRFDIDELNQTVEQFSLLLGLDPVQSELTSKDVELIYKDTSHLRLLKRLATDLCSEYMSDVASGVHDYYEDDCETMPDIPESRKWVIDFDDFHKQVVDEVNTIFDDREFRIVGDKPNLVGCTLYFGKKESKRVNASSRAFTILKAFHPDWDTEISDPLVGTKYVLSDAVKDLNRNIKHIRFKVVGDRKDRVTWRTVSEPKDESDDALHKLLLQRLEGKPKK
jgi:hypothetical protein